MKHFKHIKNISLFSIVMFLFAAWFSVFFFWNFIEYNNHVSGLLRSGSITFRGNEFEVISYYMQNCAPFAFYALVTGVLGWVLLRLKMKRVPDNAS